MTERTDFPPGVPCWIDLEVEELAEAVSFYGSLFGWQFDDTHPPGSPGDYVVARRDGADVAGIARRPPGQAAWNMYVTVDDVGAAIRRVTDAGGRLSDGPHDLPGASRIAACHDSGGAQFRLWEPRGHTGAQRVNEPGTWNFNELNTDDPTGSKAFYASVFGWQADPVDFGGETAYMVRRPGYGDFLAQFEPGIRDRQAEQGVPPGFEDAVAWMQPLRTDDTDQTNASGGGSPAPHWATSFAIDDADAAAERTSRLGGAVLVAPFDAGPGIRTAVLADPTGVSFTVTRYAPEEAEALAP